MIRKLESKPFLFFFRDHLRSTLGITCGRGSFAVHFGDHLRYCTVLNVKKNLQFCLDGQIVRSTHDQIIQHNLTNGRGIAA